MRRTKMIGLVALAVLGLTALVGTTSALANETTLCKVSASYCESSRYASGTTLKASSTNVVIVESGSFTPTISCGESVLEGKTSAMSGNPMPAEIQTWTLGKCVSFVNEEPANAEPCTTSAAKNLPASASIAVGSPPNGTITLTGGGGKVGWTINCEGLGGKCTLSFNPTLSVEGGNPAHLSASKLAMTGEGFCLSSATFTASYTVTSPQPMYVSRTTPETVFCKANEVPCPKASVYPTTAFSAATEGAAKIESNHPITCQGGSFEGATTAESGENGLPAKIYEFMLWGCSWLNLESCLVGSEALPWSTTFTLGPETIQSYMEVSGFTWRWHCESTGVNCVFSASTLKFEMTGGSPATLNVAQSLTTKGTGCPTSPIFRAKYKINSPSPLYLSRY